MEDNKYQSNCVIRGFAKKKGVYDKYRICEDTRASKFLNATVLFQDDVYMRTCDLEDVSRVFGADLYCHKDCINGYIKKYQRHQRLDHIQKI